jgi:plasmid stabilization system protein ParE
MPRLIWTDRALVDMGRLAQFLRPKSPRAAKAAIDAIRQGVRLLEAFPEAGRPVDNMEPVYRELPIGFAASGYYVYYRVDGDMVRILAVRRAREVGY